MKKDVILGLVFTCQICGETFISEGLLKFHERFHSPARETTSDIDQDFDVVKGVEKPDLKKKGKRREAKKDKKTNWKTVESIPSSDPLLVEIPELSTKFVITEVETESKSPTKDPLSSQNPSSTKTPTTSKKKKTSKRSSRSDKSSKKASPETKETTKRDSIPLTKPLRT